MSKGPLGGKRRVKGSGQFCKFQIALKNCSLQNVEAKREVLGKSETDTSLKQRAHDGGAEASAVVSVQVKYGRFFLKWARLFLIKKSKIN